MAARDTGRSGGSIMRHLNVKDNRGNILADSAAETVVQVAIDKWLVQPEPAPVAQPDEARSVVQWRAAQLRVHPAVGDGGLKRDQPTDFVKRPHDHELDLVLMDGRGSPRLVLAAGASCTGKSRSIYEALRGRVPDWRLRACQADQVSALRKREALRNRTVLWLHELDRCLRSREACAAILEVLELKPAELLVVGELSLKTLREISTSKADRRDDRYAQARCLLAQAGDPIRVPDRFTEQEFRTAKAGGRADPRLKTATAAAGRSRKVTQALAGGIWLINRVHSAEPAAGAVIGAAMDIAHLGYDRPMSETLLGKAAIGYLPDEAKNPWKKTKKAIGLWKRKSIGGLAPLRKTTGGYRLHGHLAEYRARNSDAAPPAPQLWRAFTEEVTDLSARAKLAREAERRGLYRVAWRLGLPSAKAGDPDAMALVARQFERSHPEPLMADGWWQPAATKGDAFALVRLAQRSEGRDDERSVKARWEEAVSSGNGYAVFQYAHRLRGGSDKRNKERAYELVERQARHGDPYVARILMDWLREDGRENEIPELLRRLQRSQRVQASQWLWAFEALPDLVGIPEDPELLEARLRRSAKTGYLPGMQQLADLLSRQGSVEEAEDLWIRAASLGSHVALRALIQRAGEGQAERLLAKAACEGDTYAMANLAIRLEQRNDIAEAERWWSRAAALGDLEATDCLAALLARQGRAGDVERLWRTSLENGQSRALTRLADLLVADEAKRIMQYGIDPGGATARPWDLEEGFPPSTEFG